MKLAKTKIFIAAGLISASCAFSCKKNTEAVIRKGPIVEQVQKKQKNVKRSIAIDFMIHNSDEQAACDLLDILLKEKPDAVFYEAAGASREEITNFETAINNGSLPEDSNLPVSRGFEYKSLMNGVTLYMAESYSEDEINCQHETLKEVLVLDEDIANALRTGNYSQAIKIHKLREMKLAELNFKRNNRILDTVMSKPFRKAVLLVGNSHHLLRRMFAEAGLEIKPGKEVYFSGNLAMKFEAKMRGWESGNIDESAVRDIILLEISDEYEERNFGRYDTGRNYIHFKTVASRAIKVPISPDEFIDLSKRKFGYNQNIIEILKEIGVKVPETKEEYEKALAEAGIYGCR